MKNKIYSKSAITSLGFALFFIILINNGVAALLPAYLKNVDVVYLPVLAIVFGIIGIVDIKMNKKKGLLFALSGLVIGSLWFLLLLILKKVGTV